MADKEDRQKEADRLLAEGMPTDVALATGFMYDTYVQLRNAGFNEKQALWIIGYIITGGANFPEEENK